MCAVKRIGLATSSGLPDLHVDDQPLLAALPGAEPVIWDDPDVDWGAYDLVVVRSCWDYTLRRDEFLAWARTVPRLVNPVEVLAWNTDKTYLRDLEAGGVPIVPTSFTGPEDQVFWPSVPSEPRRWVVVKPTVSAGARDTWLTQDVMSRVEQLRQAGRTAMVQPYLAAIETEGETSVVFLGGVYSHGARKAPLLAREGGDGVAPDPDDDDAIMTPRTPTAAQIEVATLAMDAIPGECLYGRVDLVPGDDGAPLVLELEITEPSLFLRQAPGSAERLAAALLARAG